MSPADKRFVVNLGHKILNPTTTPELLMTSDKFAHRPRARPSLCPAPCSADPPLFLGVELVTPPPLKYGPRQLRSDVRL